MDDGKAYIASPDLENAEKAKSMIEAIIKEVEVGEIYNGKVVRIIDIGAFVELLPGKEGMVHISKLAHEHVKNVTDVVQIGDSIQVKVTEIDSRGRINLSVKGFVAQAGRVCRAFRGRAIIMAAAEAANVAEAAITSVKRKQ